MGFISFILNRIPDIFLKPAYRVYENRLVSKIMEKQMPEHIAIIMDGNRRYAAEHSMKPWEGHRKGAEKLDDLIDWCIEFGIKELTVYALSLIHI